jgi:hypothetical protein
MEINQIAQLLEQYGSMFDQNYIYPFVFYILVIIIIFVFSVRYFAIVTVGSNNVDENDPVRMRKFKAYTAFHCVLEAIVCFIVSFIIIEFTNANPESYIINWVLGPSVGMFVAIYFDNKVIMPFEEKNGQVPYISELKSKNQSDTPPKDDDSQHLINININGTGVSTNDDDNNDSPKNNTDCDDIKRIFIEAIDHLNEAHEADVKRIEALEESNTINAIVIDAIRESILEEKKVRLKKMLYACLEQGYVKPKQNEVVLKYYHLYRSLSNGEYGHEIESIYRDRYTKMGVHENRRTKQVSVKHDRRKQPEDDTYFDINSNDTDGEMKFFEDDTN